MFQIQVAKLALLIGVGVSLVNFEGPPKKTEAIYLLAQIDVKNHQKYKKEYGAYVAKLLKEVDAAILVATSEAKVIEGEKFYNWTVIVRFENEEIFNKWYSSDEYSKLKTHRISKLANSSRLSIVPALNNKTFFKP